MVDIYMYDLRHLCSEEIELVVWLTKDEEGVDPLSKNDGPGLCCLLIEVLAHIAMFRQPFISRGRTWLPHC